MKRSLLRIAAGMAGLGVVTVLAQAPAAPQFAPPNLTEKGVRDIAATCAACHGTRGHAAPGSVVAPLAGKRREEIVETIAQFKAGTRPATIMHQLSKGYTDAEIAAVADYFSKQAR